MRNPLRDPDNRPVIEAKKFIARGLTSDIVGSAINRATGGVVPSAGLRIDTRVPAVSNSARAALFFGLYEGAERRMVRRHLAPVPTIIELGSSIGYVGSIACRHLGGAVRYVGVEANPNLITLAKRNVSSAVTGSDCTIVHGAVQYDVPLGSDVVFASSGDHSASRIASNGAETAFSAPAVTLHQLLADHDVDEFALLCDIEGGEAGVLLEDADSLARCRQMIIELHPTTLNGVNYSVSELRAHARSRGFVELEAYGSVLALQRSS